MKRNASHLVDELLVLRCQDGDAGALDLLVERCQKLFWSQAFHLTQDAEAAWEITQEAWLAIIRGIARLDDPAMFRPWAYRIITYKAADWIKRRQVQRARTQALADAADPPAPKASSGCEASDLLSGLSEAQRAILTLHYLEGLDVDEVRAVLHVPSGTVKSRLFHARNALRRLLGREQRGSP